MRWLVALVALAVSIAIPVSGQDAEPPLLEDPAGDVELAFYDIQSTPMPGGWDAVDVRFLHVIEHTDTMQFTLGVHGFPSCEATVCANSGDTRTYFSYGAKKYEVQMGINLNGFAYGMFSEIFGGEFNRQFIGQLDNTADAESATYTVHVPREWIIDENGSPPRKETQIHSIYSRAFSMVSFGGPDPNNPTGDAVDMLVTTDNMGVEAPGVVDLLLGGSTSDGDTMLASALPYRASNGGAATYRFDLQASQGLKEESRFTLDFEGVPASWNVEMPEGQLLLPRNAVADFSILITTPFGHQHGGSDAFIARIQEVDGDAWAELELGIHYVSVPQPSGHHPTLWFHSQAVPAPFGTFNTALGGVDGLLSMNTLDVDGADEQVPVQGSSGSPTNDVFRWWICLTPELLMGIDTNMSLEGSLTFPLSSPRPYDDAVLSGRMLHLGPGEDIQGCFPSNYDDRTATPIATIAATEPFSVNGATSVDAVVLPHESGDYIPFQAGSSLVLEIEVDAGSTAGAPSASGPLAMSLMPGGHITLPLDEYHDARPAGVVGWNEAPAPEDEPLDDAAFEAEPGAKDAPAALGLLGVLALALLRRR